MLLQYQLIPTPTNHEALLIRDLGAAGAWDSGAASSSWNQEPATDGGNGFSNEHGRMANTGQATIITGGSDNKCRMYVRHSLALVFFKHRTD